MPENKKNVYIYNKELDENTGIFSITKIFSKSSNKIRYSSNEENFLSELLSSIQCIQCPTAETQLSTHKDFTARWLEKNDLMIQR